MNDSQIHHKKKKINVYHKKQKIIPWLYLSPNILIFSIFVLVPSILGFFLSFFQYDGLKKPIFIGFENYLWMLEDEGFLEALIHSFLYTAIMVPLLFICSLSIAILLVKHIPFKGLFRAIIYWPTMISYIVVGFSWQWLLSDTTGIINAKLEGLGISTIPFLTNPTLALICAIFVTLWSRIGFFMIIFIGGLQSIPPEYHEAATIDGASKWQLFRSITMPLLKPTNVLVLILATIDAFKSYAIIISLTGGGPAGATTFLVQYIYDTAFGQSQKEYGYASTVSVVLFLILGTLAYIQFKTTKGGEH